MTGTGFSSPYFPFYGVLAARHIYIYILCIIMVKSVWLHDGDILTREVVEQSHSKE